MGRRRRDPGTAVSLFPFLSILACVIGSLTLIIAGVVVGQAGQGDSQAKQAEDYEATRRQNASDTERTQELKRLVAKASALERLLAEARAEAERWKALLPESPDDIRSAVPMLKRSKELRERVKELEAKLKRLQEQLARLLKRVGNKKRLAGNVVFKLVAPDGKRPKVKPSFIECRANELVIHPQNTRIAKDAIENSPVLRDHADRIKRQKDASIVLLVRPDGVGTFDAARKAIKKTGVSHGYMPLPGQGALDLGD